MVNNLHTNLYVVRYVDFIDGLLALVHGGLHIGAVHEGAEVQGGKQRHREALGVRQN